MDRELDGRLRTVEIEQAKHGQRLNTVEGVAAHNTKAVGAIRRDQRVFLAAVLGIVLTAALTVVVQSLAG